MAVVKRIINSDAVFSILSLPNSLKNKEIEVVIKPISAKKEGGSNRVVQSLIGCIPDSGLSLNEYREERVKKYELLIDTKNPADYDKSSIATKTPTEFLETFN